MTKAQVLATRVTETFGPLIQAVRVQFGEVSCDIAAADLIKVATQLRDNADFAFEILVDVCGVDYSAYGVAEWSTEEATGSGFSRGVQRNDDAAFHGVYPTEHRFAVIYHLLSIKNNTRLRLRTYALGEPPKVPSVIDVWNSANWFEREAFDMFGILFEGHPDLRRILTDYGFIGNPFRKDFPLSGHVEMRYDAKRQRVVYEPVKIEPRVLVPRVIREDHRYLKNGESAE